MVFYCIFVNKFCKKFGGRVHINPPLSPLTPPSPCVHLCPQYICNLWPSAYLKVWYVHVEEQERERERERDIELYANKMTSLAVCVSVCEWVCVRERERYRNGCKYNE